MDYSFYKLNTRDFEHLVQSFAQKILGNNSIVYGDGRDGARELTYRGKGIFSNDHDVWDGYWIIQAKFKARKFDSDDDFEWIKKNFISEMKKFQDPKRNLEKPDNYIFFTNAKLTPVQKVGGRDKIEELKQKYKNLIPNITIISYDDLCRLLDNNRDIATAYSSFILAGDVLVKLLNLLEIEEEKKLNTQRTIITYLERTFQDDLYSKLIQAGDLNNQIQIENIFIDIDVHEANESDERIKFLDQLIQFGNFKSTSEVPLKYVLVGGAGSGKSTLSQFASQIYCAFFIDEYKKNKSSNRIEAFIKKIKNVKEPQCRRIPFKVILKEYATWINKQKEANQPYSVLSYLKFRIEWFGDGNIDKEILSKFLSNISTLFIFDGLDEVPISSNRDEVIKEINRFIEIELNKYHFADAMILCTTRPQGYTKEFNENVFTHFLVSELSEADCVIYLEKLLYNFESLSIDNKQNYLNILKDALKDNVTSRLMRTPLQATIMTILVQSGGKPSRNKYKLFEEYYDTIYKRELQKELLPILKDYRRNIDDIHALLGFELQLNSEGIENPSALIENTEFQKLIKIYLKEKEEWADNDINNFINNIKNVVTERLVFISDIQDGKIGFVIRSLQEFFAANYLINFKDEKVIENIQSISNSSYWRNTLLFAISGIHNTKNHLIDLVYVHCERLNGNEDDPTKPSINNALLFGSSLSLEILAEGIFSDSPKNKGRFSRLLEKLFLSINIIDLSKFEFLPSEILLNLIIQKYITENLFSEQSFKEKSISYELLFLLLNNKTYKDISMELLNKAWKEEYEYDLIKLMVDVNAIESEYVIEKLSNAFLKDEYYNYSYVIRRDAHRNYNIVRSLSRKHLENKLVISRIIEMAFLNAMNRNLRNNRKLFSLFNAFLRKLKYKNFRFYQNSDFYIQSFKSIEVVKGHEVEIGIIYSESPLLHLFQILFKLYSLNYLYSYTEYLRCPNANNLSIFFNELKLLKNKEIFDTILARNKNWVINSITSQFDNYLQITNIIEAIEKKHFGDVTSWKIQEDKMLTQKDIESILKFGDILRIDYDKNPRIDYSKNLRIDYDESPLNNFYQKYEQYILENNFSFNFELLTILGRLRHVDEVFDEGSNNSKFQLSEKVVNAIVKFINGIEINSLSKKHTDEISRTIIMLIYFGDLTVMDKINSKLFTLFEVGKIYPFSRNIHINVLYKCIDFFNLSQILKRNNRIEYLLLSMILDTSAYGLISIPTINFYDMTSSKNDNIYSLLLRLITLKISIDDIDLIINNLDNELKKNEFYYELSNYFLFGTKTTDTKILEFFSRLYLKLIKNHRIPKYIIENIAEFIKTTIESKKIEIQNVQIILKDN